MAPAGRVLGIDVSRRMVELALRRSQRLKATNCSFAPMGADELTLPDGSFDVVLCTLGLMYVPDPNQALREMRRVLRPGGRVVIAVWGERLKCGWSALFPIVDAEVASEVGPRKPSHGHASMRSLKSRNCVGSLRP